MKAIRSLETDRIDLEPENWNDKELEQELTVATDKRLYAIAEAIRRGMTIEQIADLTKWDEFFVRKVQEPGGDGDGAQAARTADARAFAHGQAHGLSGREHRQVLPR